MKPGRKKTRQEEIPEEIPASGTVAAVTVDVPAGSAGRETPGGIDGVRVLQATSAGIAVAMILWLVFHTLLHVF